MIVVTRFNESQFAVNPDLIERIHANPDTTLVMVDGATYIVTETMAQVIELIAQFRAHVVSIARGSAAPFPAIDAKAAIATSPVSALHAVGTTLHATADTSDTRVTTDKGAS
jgi:flagellar protein FlbD